LKGSFVTAVACIFAASIGFAHHPVAAKFDTNRRINLKGTVTSVDWANPHAHVFIDVKESAVVTNWAIELESTVDLRRGGWSARTVKPGDEITVEGSPARDGSKQVWANSVALAASGRKIFTVASEAYSEKTAGDMPVPRWPDGHPRLSALPGQSGYWSGPSATSLFETGGNIQFDGHGLLKNIADAPKVAPFQTWARDLYTYRQRTFLKDDPMYLYCLPPGGPRLYQTKFGIQFMEEQRRDRIFVLMGGANRNWHLIYTDGREQRGQLGGDDDNPLYYGRSVAQWQGDTLVVDSKGFNEKFWFSNGGLPHTEKLHLVERITRSDFDTLKYEVTVEDPGAYTRTWTSSWTLHWVAGQDPPEYYCQDNRP
jgi:hypothetical protein